MDKDHKDPAADAVVEARVMGVVWAAGAAADKVAAWAVKAVEWVVRVVEWVAAWVPAKTEIKE